MSDAAFYLDKALLPDTITGGVWAATITDQSEQIDCVFPTEIEALRVVVGRGYGSVAFIRWGEDLRDTRIREGMGEASE